MRIGTLAANGDLGLASLHQVAVPTADLARSVAFYRDALGLRLLAQFSPPGLAFFALGETRLLVEHSPDPKPAGGVLYFRVVDIHAACATLRARGVAIDSGPHAIHHDDDGTFGERGATEWMAFFRDPDGNLLALASRVPPEKKP
jgi:catechol 2,3-dioxygenase-like lactoylglutathione lyase family enzyme